MAGGESERENTGEEEMRNLTEDNILSVAPRRRSGCDEELNEETPKEE